MDGEKDFPTFNPFYRINLCNREVRIFLSVIQILRIGPAIATLFVDLPVLPALAFGKTDSVGRSMFLAVKRSESIRR